MPISVISTAPKLSSKPPIRWNHFLLVMKVECFNIADRFGSIHSIGFRRRVSLKLCKFIFQSTCIGFIFGLWVSSNRTKMGNPKYKSFGVFQLINIWNSEIFRVNSFNNRCNNLIRIILIKPFHHNLIYHALELSSKGTTVCFRLSCSRFTIWIRYPGRHSTNESRNSTKSLFV